MLTELALLAVLKAIQLSTVAAAAVVVVFLNTVITGRDQKKGPSEWPVSGALYCRNR